MNHKQAIANSKLLYEIRNRKKEFLSICVKYDYDFSSKVSKTGFETILDEFTCYPTREEKEMIVSFFLINEKHINYIDLCTFKSDEDVQYQDPLLIHLNSLKSKLDKDKHNLILNSKGIGNAVDLTPLELFNYEVSEENFVKGVSKKILEVIYTTQKENVKIEELLKKFDFDCDEKFTIGEVNLLLNALNIPLADWDLRFFFEQISPIEGKVELQFFTSFIQDSALRKFGKPVNIQQIEALTKDDKQEASKTQRIMTENYVVLSLKECLTILGVSYMLRYFNSVVNNLGFILIDHLEIGMRKLGYRQPSAFDIGNFKFLCIQMDFAVIEGENFCFHLERLLHFIEGNEKVTYSPHDILKQMNTKIFEDLNEKFSSYIGSKSTIDEFHFRRNFIKSFGFIDHSHIGSVMDYIKEEKTQNEFTLGTGTSSFTMETVSPHLWSKYLYNLLFMGLISNSNSLLLDTTERLHLQDIYRNLHVRLFSQVQVGKDHAPTAGNYTFDKKTEPHKEDKERKINLIEYKTDNLKVEGGKETDKKLIKEESRANFKPCDTAEIIPKLYQMCSEYLKNKFKLDHINKKLISSLGVCQIFRDQLKRMNIPYHNEIDHKIFLDAIETTVENSQVFNFLRFYSLKFTKENKLNVQYFFSLLEQILTRYADTVEK